MFSTLFSTTLWKTVEKQWKSREGMWERVKIKLAVSADQSLLLWEKGDRDSGG